MNRPDPVAAAQKARQLKTKYRSHTVAEKRKRQVQMPFKNSGRLFDRI
jgi:hypothetical protein